MSGNTEEPDRKRRKKDGFPGNMSAREFKKHKIGLIKTTEQMRKKAEARMEKESLEWTRPHLSLTLGKIAYDAARSGTEVQVQDITNTAAHVLKLAYGGSVMGDIKGLLDDASKYAESASLFALAGIVPAIDTVVGVDDIYSLLLQNATALILSAVQTVCGKEDGTATTNNTKTPTILQASNQTIWKSIVEIIDSFAMSGYGGAAPNYSNVVGLEGMAQALSPLRTYYSGSDKLTNSSSEKCATEAIDALVEFAKNEIYVGPTYKKYWLHTPNGRPLTRLWNHSKTQKKVRTADAPSAPGVRLAKLAYAAGRKKNIGASAAAGAAAAAASTAYAGASRLCDDDDDDREDEEEEAKAIAAAVVAMKKTKENFIWKGDSPVGFADMNKPLVVDVGCGFGVSLLGLASAVANGDIRASQWADCNFLGGDLSSHCVAYAQGIASRWGISSTCRFCVAPAEDFLQWVLDYYPGPVVGILVQFPTPYKLDLGLSHVLSSSSSGKHKHKDLSQAVGKNSQLPTLQLSQVAGARKGADAGAGAAVDEEDDTSGFMVTHRLMRLAVAIARKTSSYSSSSSSSTLIYAQSNVEDVCVTMRYRFELALQREKERELSNSARNSSNRSSIGENSKMSSALGAVVITHLLPFDDSESQRIVNQAKSSSLAVAVVPEGGETSSIRGPTASKRQLMWAAAGGERAAISSVVATVPAAPVLKSNSSSSSSTSKIGAIEPWIAGSPLPVFGRTETEAAYAEMNKAVFRIAWNVR